jgi:tetratricopeptide (TPR) repeat protein
MGMRDLCLLRIFVTIFIVFNAVPASYAQDLELYQKGLSQYQEKDFEAAAQAFESALKADPMNPYVLYNWGLSQYELGNNGFAFAAWRKALNLRPTLLSVSDAIDHLVKTRPLPGRRGPQGHWEVFRTSALVYLPESLLVFITALFLCCAGWLWIRYMAERNVAIEEELPLPQLPLLGGLFAILFVAFQVLSVAKVYESYQVRGVVTTRSVAMRAVPEEAGSELFQIAEGAEVLVLRRQGDWLQIKYPSGLAGWVPEEAVFQTTQREI